MTWLASDMPPDGDLLSHLQTLWGLFGSFESPPWEMYALAAPAMFVWFACIGAALGVAGRVPVLPSAIVGCFPFLGVAALGLVAGVRRRMGYAESYSWRPRAAPAPSRSAGARAVVLGAQLAIVLALAGVVAVDLASFSHPSMGAQSIHGSENHMWQWVAVTAALCAAAGALYALRHPLWAAAVAVTVGCWWWASLIQMSFALDLLMSALKAGGAVYGELSWLLTLVGIELSQDLGELAAGAAGMTLTAGPGFWLLLSVGAASALWGCALIVLEVAAMRWEDVDLGARHWALT